jgi:hypothetical protein
MRDIKMDFLEVRMGGMDWVDLDSDRCWAFMMAVMSLWVA